jgi:LmbE family N-acetylglucosaminyl deacetylase
MPGILMVLAHPDDESFVGGGTLYYYRQRGVPNALICFTDGQSGRQGPVRPGILSPGKDQQRISSLARNRPL